MGGFGGGETTPRSDLNNLKSRLLLNDDKTNPGYAQPLAGGVGTSQVICNPNPGWIGSVVSILDDKAFSFDFQIDVKHGGPNVLTTVLEKITIHQ